MLLEPVVESDLSWNMPHEHWIHRHMVPCVLCNPHPWEEGTTWTWARCTWYKNRSKQLSLFLIRYPHLDNKLIFINKRESKHHDMKQWVCAALVIAVTDVKTWVDVCSFCYTYFLKKNTPNWVRYFDNEMWFSLLCKTFCNMSDCEFLLISYITWGCSSDATRTVYSK